MATQRAAALVSAALEGGLTRFARLKGLEVDDKKVQDVVNALKGRRLSSTCRWRRLQHRRRTALRDRLLLVRAQVDDMLARVERRR